MAIQHIVRIRNRAGVRQYDVTDFLALNYSKYLNGFGLLNVDLKGNHQAIDALEKDGQIEVWRFDEADGLDPYVDFYGFYRDRDRRTPAENKNGIFTMKCVEQKQYLWRAVLDFPAGTNLRNDFTADPAETVMKLMVQYNLTADATTANGRKSDIGTFANNITVEADGGGGSDITKAFAHMKLLAALQEVAVLGGIDFDLVKTGARAWEFRTYAPLGQDLTSSVKFSLAWDNLGEPALIGNAIDEETVALVWGEDTGVNREFLQVFGPNYNADWNHIETYVNASQQGATSLQDAGTVRMNEVRARDDFTFNVLQSGAYRYGRDYCIEGVLGDLVSVTYYEEAVTKRIRGAHVAVATSSGGQSAEQIKLDLVTV